ncbi:MAG: hypothetical protein HY727_02680 [Candidatus Rokubacteria bacterium]|nr:hypothetical protein [Candidatus Rokubacteria bacterium]
MRTASWPFVFVGCVELRQALDAHAHDARELGQRLQEVPADSVFFHTYGYLLRHRPLTIAYGNDFARWAAVELGDQRLAERLAIVDPLAFAGLEALRGELVTIIHDHLREAGGAAARADAPGAFHFQQSHIVEVDLGLRATTLEEFREALAGVDASAIYLHMVEARVRRGRRAGDFGEWLREALGLATLADQAERIDAYMATLERVRARLLALVDEARESGAGC